MFNLTESVLYFMQTGIVDPYNLRSVEAFQDFLDELDLQEQINETECP